MPSTEGRSVHGEFGPVDAWYTRQDLRSGVQAALAKGHAEWTQVARGLLAGTPFQEDDETTLADWAINELADAVDRTAEEARVADLSEALAQAGVLPMFGFPTQVRILYTAAPRHPLQLRVRYRSTSVSSRPINPRFNPQAESFRIVRSPTKWRATAW
jgi:hypothetical protein